MSLKTRMLAFLLTAFHVRYWVCLKSDGPVTITLRNPYRNRKVR